MKNLFIFSLIFLMGIEAFSQNQGITIKEARKIMKTAIYQAPNNIVVNSGQATKINTDVTLLDPEEETIGNTYYDLQSNSLLQNRIYRWEDGSIGAVWTRGVEQAPTFPDRGTGYNYFDGTTWGPVPTTRIESEKTGWPSYAPLGPNGEIVVSHKISMGNFSLFISTREEKGTGGWNETTYTGTPGPGSISFPRIQTSGPERNIIHILANSMFEYLGQNFALLYSRSMDAGQTWDIQNVVLEGTGINYYSEIRMDDYVWSDMRNGEIAFLCASPWHDMFMMKSDNDGESWEKTIIWEHPYPFFDWNTTITDTFFCVDNSASIALDANGKAHVVFGISRVGVFEAGGSYNYWPYCDGIGYWNEDMDEFSDDIHALSPPDWGYSNTEMVEDYNYIGWTQDVDGDDVITFGNEIMTYRELGVSTMPTISVDDAGYVWILFASTTETYVYLDYNYKHIWARAGYNGEWSEFHDLTHSIFHLVDECIYPQLTSNSDDNIHYFYQLDQIPGLALDEDHEYVDNTEVYGTIDKMEFFWNFDPYQIIFVNPGFQFVSSYISPENPDLEDVAADIINDDLEYIRNSEGAMLRKIGPNWVNGIGDWIGTEGYLIKTSANGTFILSGSLIDPSTPIQITAGFQFISYLLGTPMDALEAFASIIGDDLVYVRNSAGNMLRKIGPNWVNGIGDCIPTEGYLIKMNADGELVYPTDGAPSSVTLAEKLGEHWNVQGNPAEAIWALYIGGAENYISGDLVEGDEIAIFDGDLVVGCFTLTQVCNPENQFDNFLNAFSQLFDGPGFTVGNPISFKAWIQNVNFEFGLFYYFTNPFGDAYVGDEFPEGEPYSLVTFEGPDGIKENEINVSIYPNPATNTLNINADTEVTNIKVLNYIGQTINMFNVSGNEVTINTSTYDSGIYFIQIETEKGISTQKIVIE